MLGWRILALLRMLGWRILQGFQSLFHFSRNASGVRTRKGHKAIAVLVQQPFVILSAVKNIIDLYMVILDLI